MKKFLLKTLVIVLLEIGGVTVGLMLIGSWLDSALATETLPPNQLMIQEPEMSPTAVRKIVFCEDCVIIEKTKDHFVTAPHGVIKVMYTDGKGKPSPVYINPLEGYVQAGGEIFPFPAKLTTLDAYNPEID